MSFQSVHDLLTPPGVVRKQKFWDFCDGTDIRSWWRFADKSGSGSSGMVDAINDGMFLTCGSTNGNASLLDFNNLQQYDHDACVFDVTWRLPSTTGVNSNIGLFEDVLTTVNQSIFMSFDSFGGATNYVFATRDGVGGGSVDTGIAADTNSHRMRGDLAVSSARGFIDNVLVGLRTSNLATAALQPTLFQANRVTTSTRTMYCSRFEAYNT
jgi:hypothetical protein